VSFVKIDVEGAELRVLAGGHNAIQRDRPLVLCELLQPFQRRFGSSCQEVLDFFNRYDYRGFHLRGTVVREGRVMFDPLDLARLSATEANNVLFGPAERLGWMVDRLR
jgi:Methyltransferase FkbM domain